LTEILKQPQYSPVPQEKQVMIIYAGTNGFLDKVPLARVRDWILAFYKFMDTQYADIGEEIRREKRMSDELLARLRTACEEFAKSWS